MGRRRGRTVLLLAIALVAGASLAGSTGALVGPTVEPTPPPTPTPPPIPPVKGMWLSPEEVAALPTSGPAWTALLAIADAGPGRPVDVSDQDSQHARETFATALVAARVGGAYVDTVVAAIDGIIDTEFGDRGGHSAENRVLAWGRNIGSYVLAADLIDLRSVDPDLDARFRTWLRSMLTATSVPDAAAQYSLRGADSSDPGNWGAWSGATHAAIAVYLRDPAEVELTRRSLERFLTTGAGFEYRDTWAITREEGGWSTVPDRTGPIPPINPPGARIDGRDVDGIVVADMRRGSPEFDWPPAHTTYPREAISGRVIQAEILYRLRLDPYAWGDDALERVALRLVALERETGDDWYEAGQAPMWILRQRHPTAGLDVSGTPVGRMIAGTDWTHPAER